MERRQEVCEWEGRVCACAQRDVPIDTQGRGLGEDVADLRLELGVKGGAAEAELILVVLWMLNSRSCIKADGFPMSHEHTVKAARGARNGQA